MKRRTLIIDPQTSFEPRASTKRTWLSTRKRAFTASASDGHFCHPGFFDTDDFGRDTGWFLFAMALEAYSLVALRSVGAFESFAVLAGFWLIDIICAGFAHAGAADSAIFRANFRLARNKDEENWAGQFRPAMWRRLVKGAGILGLLASAVIKALFFVANAQFSIHTFAVPLCYALAAYIHVFKTGFFLAHLWFLFRLNCDWRRYARGDTDLCFTHPRALNFRAVPEATAIRVNRQQLNDDGRGGFTLGVMGVLQDDEAADLASQQPTTAARDAVLRACLQFQLGQLSLNPNQAIVRSAKPAGGFPIAALLPMLLISFLLLPACAKPKEKVSGARSLDVVLILSGLKDDRLPPDIVEMLAPFRLSEGRALVSKVKIHFRRGDDHSWSETNLELDRSEVQPDLLNRLVGASGAPLEQLKDRWAAKAKAPLLLGDHSAPNSGSLPLGGAELEYIRQTVQAVAPALVLSRACRNAEALKTEFLQLENAQDFQSAAIKCLQAGSAQKNQRLVVLCGLDFPGEGSDPRITSSPPPTTTGNVVEQTVRSDIRQRLPEAVRAILDKGTARLVTSIFFATDSAEIPLAGLADLDLVAGEIQKLSSPVLIVTAYADKRGSEDHKLWLSRERALALTRQLQRRKIGIAASIGLSDYLPADQTSTAEGLALNRRADLILIDRAADGSPTQKERDKTVSSDR